MTRLIDADALIKALDIGDLPIRLTYEISNAPTIDAVPVIRCKDCKHWQRDDSESYCDELGIFGTDMNSYCSYAKGKAWK